VDIAISNTSPLLYLYRIGGLMWLARLFTEVWVPDAVIAELEAGRKRGYDVPVIEQYPWIKRVNPRHVPEEWLVLDLGPGELVTLALAFEHREQVVLLDDLLARRIAKAAGLQLWGTLRVLLEAKAQGMIPELAPYVNKLVQAGMWVSEDIRRRIFRLSGETA
jgi:predicted nucleic acid-binding protein